MVNSKTRRLREIKAVLEKPAAELPRESVETQIARLDAAISLGHLVTALMADVIRVLSTAKNRALTRHRCR